MDRIEALPLPGTRHYPGSGTVPDERLLKAVVAQVLPATKREQAAYNLVWRYGVRLLNAGFFWEAHEVLEPVWTRAAPNSRERFLLQAVIHIANAGLKEDLGMAKAARRLCQLALICCEQAFLNHPDRLMGLAQIDVESAAAAIEAGNTEVWLTLYFPPFGRKAAGAG